MPTARCCGSVPAAEGEYEFNLRYPGQYFDKESGLHYNGFRTYDPQTGRYTQGDPIGLSGGWNRFGYVGGNALFAVDPNGLQASQIAGRYGVIGGNSGPGGSRGGYDAQLDMYRPGSPSALERLANGVAKQCKAVRDWMFSEEADKPDGEPLSERKTNPSKQDSPVWNDLDRAKDGLKTSGNGSKQRYYDWDCTHDDIEVYDQNGRHLGSMEPVTGEMYKPPVPGRKINKP